MEIIGGRDQRSGESPATVVVLVEGTSDRVALETLARRQGRDLGAEGIEIVVMGGATNLGHQLERLRHQWPSPRLAGLCDLGEERVFRRYLEAAGHGPVGTRAELEGLGFFVCEDDLEDELIRSLGEDAVIDVIEAQGELGTFRKFQNQPAQRGRPLGAHLHRFMGIRSGRKAAYARALVEALDIDLAPLPLVRLLSRI